MDGRDQLPELGLCQLATTGHRKPTTKQKVIDYFKDERGYRSRIVNPIDDIYLSDLVYVFAEIKETVSSQVIKVRHDAVLFGICFMINNRLGVCIYLVS